jgi:glucose/arabinose dehydrogenase
MRRSFVTTLTALLALAPLAVLAPVTAGAETVAGPTSDPIELSGAALSADPTVLNVAAGGDVPVVGDWDGNGTTTIGVRRGATFLLRNENTTGVADITADFGLASDVPIVGDWDGDGTTTVGVWRDGAFYLRNSNTTGVADIVVSFGLAGDQPVVGDWDGDGTTTLGVRRGGTTYFRNSNTTGQADSEATYGVPGDVPLAGDWDGNGTDTLGVRRGATWYLRNSNTTGEADITLTYGETEVPPPPPAPTLAVAPVMVGLTNPWDVAFTPDGSMLVTERPGRLLVRLPDGTVRQLTADMSDLFVSGETGLMGLEVDPNFAANRRIYTCQGKVGPSVQVVAWTVDAAYTRADRVADPLVGGLPSSGGRHAGCRPRFGPDGQLWIGTGDAATGTNPQDLSSLGGKVLRVDPVTGAPSPDNPFIGVPGADARILTLGHRNVQGLAPRPGTNEVWEVEQGSDRDDEVNLLTSGGNYGWNPVPGYNEAVPMTFAGGIPAVWSSGFPTLATSGGTFLSGAAWGPWQGALAVAALKAERLVVFQLSGDSIVGAAIPGNLAGAYGRLRTPRLGPDGSLYITTDNGGGTDQVLRVTPS